MSVRGNKARDTAQHFIPFNVELASLGDWTQRVTRIKQSYILGHLLWGLLIEFLMWRPD
jgi:hypothetical protein